MMNTVARFIAQHHLLSPAQPVLVALSGGADSVALLRILLQLGYPCTACHCNFHLRGEESNRDEQFVRRLCSSLQVPIYITHFDTTAYAQQHKQSIEMAARDLRYAYFQQVLLETGITVIAVAHHQADQAETVLLNLLRGSGVHGLRGMLPKNESIIRPLLDCTKDQLLSYLAALGQDYVTDSTNLELDARRNQLRLQIIPQLQTINPQVIQALAHTAAILADTEQLLNTGVQQQLAAYKIGEESYRSQLITHPQASLLLHEWLAPKGFNRTQVSQILSASSGRFLSLDLQWTLWVTPQELTLVPNTPPQPPVIQETVFLKDQQPLLRDAHYAFLDADKVQLPWHIRQVQLGDKFRPLGMKGTKLINDYLTDHKVKPWQRANQWVVTDATGQILWLVGHRIDDRYKLTESSQHIIRLELKQK